MNGAWQAADTAEQAGNWAEAARRYQRVIEIGETRGVGDYLSLFGLARCRARQGRPKDAMKHLAAAVELGLNDANAIMAAPALEPLRGQAEFKAIVEAARRVDDEKIATYVPASIPRGEPVPLIIAFHGLGENERMHLSYWRKAAEELRVVVAAPRGVHRRADIHSNFNTWHHSLKGQKSDNADIDVPASLAITNQAIALAKSKANIDGERIILAGLSQGGSVALRLFAEEPERFAGVWTEAALYKTSGAECLKRIAAKQSARAYIMYGELDALAPKSRQAADDLKGAGVNVRLVKLANAGHEGPADFVSRQVEGVQFILERPPDPGNRPYPPAP